MAKPNIVLREARNQDAEGIIALIAACYAEYPPNVLDVDAEEPELRSPASSFVAFWVLEDSAGRILGSIALALREAGAVVELKKCYVAASLRGQGWGRRLIQTVEAWAQEHAASKVELWTDTRFRLAHKVYARLGYRRSSRTRELHDLSQTTEAYYQKLL